MTPLNELRIDNLFNYKGSLIRIDSIDRDSFTAVLADNRPAGPVRFELGSVDVQPVRLTTSLLAQIGFVPYDWGQFEGIMEHYTDPERKVYLRFHKEGVSVFTEGMIPEVFNYIASIIFFHQLQNLFFDISGQEVPIPDTLMLGQ